MAEENVEATNASEVEAQAAEVQEAVAAEVQEAEAEEAAQEAEGNAEIRDTDIVFDCPHCGKNLVIDYRGAGLQIDCSGCGESVLVPIPDGMELTDLDMDAGEVLKQLFATRKNYQRAELQIEALKGQLMQLQEALGVMQEVVAEGLKSAS